MNSTQLAEYGLSSWTSFALEDGSMPRWFSANLPDWPGVYAIRAPSPLPRWSGESDVLYIGCAASLKKRISRYFHEGGDGTNYRIWSLLLDGLALEIAWVWSPERRELEAKLLDQYEWDHRELPPLNRQRGLSRRSE